MALSKHQKFETMEMSRAEIKGAAYNPRKIDEDARKRLKSNLKKVGLIEPLVLNKRTGNLVSGHQRLSILDDLEGSGDYSLTVSVVDLSEKEEKEQNVFLNNPSSQGYFERDLLAELIKDPEFSWDDAGLTPNDLNILGLESLDIDEAESPAIEDAKEKFQKGLEHTQAERKDYEARNSKDDPEFFITTIFRDRAAKERFLERHKLNEDTKYLSGEALEALIFHAKPIDGEVTLALHVTPEVLEIWQDTKEKAATELGYGPDYPGKDGRIFELALAEFRGGLNLAESE